MGKITVSFLGVCTIFRDLPGQTGRTDVPPNRVALVRATEEIIHKHHILPHRAKLQLVAKNIQWSGPKLPPADPPLENTYSLSEGVHLRIANSPGADSGLTGFIDSLPGLQAYLDRPLGPPAEWVFVPTPERVQAWFDIEHGEIRSHFMSPIPCCPTTSSMAFLTIPAEEKPPVLEVTPWTGPNKGITSTVSFPDDDAPNINVMNFAEGEALIKDNRDFILNYLLAAEMPPLDLISIPLENVCRTPSPLKYRVNGCGDAGPGCSTTQFP